MILSISRRTDIPAFYTPWFFNRLKAGYLMVRNPMNPNQVSQVVVNPEVVECMVFWTKDPRPMLPYLDQLEAYHYYFQFTLTPYDRTLEPRVASKKVLIEAFIHLSNKIGKERVVWRYDPIVLTEKFDRAYHERCFDYLASRLSGHTEKCVISFLDLYAKTQRNMKSVQLQTNDRQTLKEVAYSLARIAEKYNIQLETCCEAMDLTEGNIRKSRCIDPELISRLTGMGMGIGTGLGIETILAKDGGQRDGCGCIKSLDVGAYNTCRHGCLYCYANFNEALVAQNKALHDPESPFLLGSLKGNEKIYLKNEKNKVAKQLSLFPME